MKAFSKERSPGAAERVAQVTSDAHEQLQEWGCTATAIAGLARISARYRYDNCQEKIEQIVKRGGEVIQTDNGEAVQLPDFLEFDGERINGQCAEIATRVYKDLTREWLAQNDSLELTWLTGEPRTHFSGSESHHWLGVAPRGAKAEDMVAIDGSFLEISRQADNGYKPAAVYEGLPQSSYGRLAVELPLGELDYGDANDLFMHARAPSVIGLTRDLAHIVTLGFLIDRTTTDGHIRPLIHVTGADKQATAFYVNSAKAPIRYDQENIMSPDNHSEVGQLLKTIEGIRLTDR